MKAAPKLDPCEMPIPDALQRAAERAERRRDAALGRLEVKLDIDGKTAAQPKQGE